MESREEPDIRKLPGELLDVVFRHVPNRTTLSLLAAGLLFLLVLSGILWVKAGAIYIGAVVALLMVGALFALEGRIEPEGPCRPKSRKIGHVLLALAVMLFIFLKSDPWFSQTFKPDSQKFRIAKTRTPTTSLWNLSRDKILRNVAPNTVLQVVDENTKGVLIHLPDSSENWIQKNMKPAKQKGQYWVRSSQIAFETHYLRFPFHQYRTLQAISAFLFLGGIVAYVSSFLAPKSPEANFIFPENSENAPFDPLLKISSARLAGTIPGNGVANPYVTYSNGSSAPASAPEQDWIEPVKMEESTSNAHPPPPGPDIFQPDAFDNSAIIQSNEMPAPAVQASSKGEILSLASKPRLFQESMRLMELLLNPSLPKLESGLDEAAHRMDKMVEAGTAEGIDVEATGEFRQLVALLLYNRGRAAAESQAWGSAVTLYQRVVDLYNQEEDLAKITSYAAFEGSRCCFELKDPDWNQALRFCANCNPTLLDEHKQPYYYSFLGEIYYNRGDWERAEECFHYFSTLNRSGVEMVMVQRAKCLRNLGRYDEAHILLLDSRLHEKDDIPRLQCELNYVLADILTIQNNIDEAIQAYEHVLQVDPGFKDVPERLRKLRKIQEKKIELDADANAQLLGPTLTNSFQRINCPKCGSHVSSLMMNCPYCQADLEGQPKMQVTGERAKPSPPDIEEV